MLVRHDREPHILVWSSFNEHFTPLTPSETLNHSGFIFGFLIIRLNLKFVENVIAFICLCLDVFREASFSNCPGSPGTHNPPVLTCQASGIAIAPMPSREIFRTS